jgi:D-alanyl-D-alanine carboxypeptidase
MTKHSKHHHIDSALVYGFAVLSVIALSNVEKIIQKVERKISPATVHIVEEKQLFNKEAFAKVVTQGKAYVLYDIVDEKIIAGKNEVVMLPLASLTKVMTAVTARTHFDKTKRITITSKSVDGTYDLGLRNGQVFDLDELLKYTLVFSSNDGAQAIADGLGGRDSFVALMNSDAEKLGLAMHFTQPAGLDEGAKLGGKGSALSVAKLLAIAHRNFPEVFDATTKTRVSVQSSTGKITGVPNTNQEVNNFSGIEMSKTGFTDKAGGNLAIIVDVVLGHPVAIIVLGSTRDARFSDVAILYAALQKSVQK